MRTTIPKQGRIRVRKAFLFFSLTIGKDMRWFEMAEWIEQANEYINAITKQDTGTRWDPVMWMDDVKNPELLQETLKKQDEDPQHTLPFFSGTNVLSQSPKEDD